MKVARWRRWDSSEDQLERCPRPPNRCRGACVRRGRVWGQRTGREHRPALLTVAQATPPGGASPGRGPPSTQEDRPAAQGRKCPGQRTPVQEWSLAERRRVAGRGGAQPGAQGQREAPFPWSGQSSGKVSCPQRAVSCPQAPGLPEAGLAVEPGCPGQRTTWGRQSQRLPICQREDQVPRVWSQETSACLSTCGLCGLSIRFPICEVGRKVPI